MTTQRVDAGDIGVVDFAIQVQITSNLKKIRGSDGIDAAQALHAADVQVVDTQVATGIAEEGRHDSFLASIERSIG